MKERKTFSFLIVVAALFPALLGGSVAPHHPVGSLLLPVLGLLISLFGVAYLLASEKSWHAMLCGLASIGGLLLNSYVLLFLLWLAESGQFSPGN